LLGLIDCPFKTNGNKSSQQMAALTLLRIVIFI